MSADLLAEFDAFYQPDPPAKNNTRSSSATRDQIGLWPTSYSPANEQCIQKSDESLIRSPESSRVLTHLGTSEQRPYKTDRQFIHSQNQTAQSNDDWASFEQVSSSHGHSELGNVDATQVDTSAAPQTRQQNGKQQDLRPKPRLPGFAAQNGRQGTGPDDVPAPRRAPLKSRRPPRDESVLFDAEEDQEDDEFGEFESGQNTATTALPSTRLNHAVLARPTASLLDFDSFTSTVDRTTRSPLASNVQRPTFTESDWFDGQSATVSNPSPGVYRQEYSNSVPENDSGPPHLRFDAFPPQNDSTSSSTPPTNLPPPALILTLFPPLLDLAQSRLFEPLSNHSNTLATREAIMGHPETQTFMASYLAIIGVLARIIAGRKFRWKRDTILAQSMRIGPASASGRSGGMKLTGVDRAENAREEREVNDIFVIWRAQLGRLRSTISNVASHLHVPELAEAPIVLTVKENEGGIVAPKPCALCGLKRNERISKVDINVQDSFGEWWVEYWGHRSCKSFWDIQSSNLTTR